MTFDKKPKRRSHVGICLQECSRQRELQVQKLWSWKMFCSIWVMAKKPAWLKQARQRERVAGNEIRTYWELRSCKTCISWLDCFTELDEKLLTYCFSYLLLCNKNHLKLSGLKQCIFYYCLQVCRSAGEFWSHLAVSWVLMVLDGLTHTSSSGYPGWYKQVSPGIIHLCSRWLLILS